MQPQNLTPPFLLVLLATFTLFSCADKPTEPELTKEEIRQIIAEELAKMTEGDTLTPQEVAEIALKSTVYLRVRNVQGKNMFGSGFVVGTGGLIATSYHLIADINDIEEGNTVRLVREAGEHSIDSTVAVDKEHDLAIIRATSVIAPPLPLGDSGKMRIGDTVYVVGNPDGYAGTFSLGVLSGVRHDDPLVADRVFQMTSHVAKGSSGGPILNKEGEVIGVVNGGDAGGNISFATPVNFLKALLATIR